MEAEGRGRPHRDRDEVAIVAEDTRLDQIGVDLRALRKVLKHAGQLENFRIGKAARRKRRHDEPDIGDAVEHHLCLLLGRAAQCPIRVELDLNRTAQSAFTAAANGFLTVL